MDHHTHTHRGEEAAVLVSLLSAEQQRSLRLSVTHTHRNKLYAAEKEKGHTADTHQDTHTSQLHCVCVGPSVCVWVYRGAQISTEWLLL